jgi:hypothetical protein
MASRRPAVRSKRKRPKQSRAAALVTEAEFRLGHLRWLWLWKGTLRLLETHEPRAYQRVLAKLQRHGLAGLTLDFRSEDSRQIIEEYLAPVGTLTDLVPSDMIARATQAYARDRQAVGLRGRRTRRVPPRIRLVMAYRAACWKLRQERDEQPRPLLRGGLTLKERAAALVGQRYSLEPDSAAVLIRRATAALHPTWRRWIDQVVDTQKLDGREFSGGELLWNIFMKN